MGTRRARWGLLGCVAVAAWPGCTCPRRAAPPVDAARVVEAAVETADDVPDPEAWLPREDAGLASATRQADAAAPRLLVQGAALSRDVTPPDDDGLLRALRGNGPGVFRLLGGPKALGDGRFVAVALVRDGADGAGLELSAVLASSAAGRVTVEARLALPVEEFSLNHYTDDDEGPTECAPRLVDRVVGDLDHDGEPEAAVLLQYCTPPATGLGYILRREAFVLDATPTLRVAAQVVLWDEPQDERRDRVRLHLAWRDADGDGHPDIALDGARCVSLDPDTRQDADGGAGPFPRLGSARRPCERVSLTMAWRRGRDGWSLAAP